MLSHLRGKRSSFQVSLDVHASRSTKRQSVKNELINQLVRLSGSGHWMQLCSVFVSTAPRSATVPKRFEAIIALMRGIDFSWAGVTTGATIFFLVLLLCQPYNSSAQTVS